MLFVSGVSSWQRAQVSANWRHSMSGAQRNDKEKRPNKTLIHCADLKSPLTFTNEGPSFCKLFRRRSPAKLPVQLRRGYWHHSCKLWHPCALMYPKSRGKVQAKLSLAMLFSSSQGKLVQDTRLYPAVLLALSSQSSTCQRYGMGCCCKVSIWGEVWWVGKLYKSNSNW